MANVIIKNIMSNPQVINSLKEKGELSANDYRELILDQLVVMSAISRKTLNSFIGVAVDLHMAHLQDMAKDNPTYEYIECEKKLKIRKVKIS